MENASAAIYLIIENLILQPKDVIHSKVFIMMDQIVIRHLDV
jgi:hypothetical protein